MFALGLSLGLSFGDPQKAVFNPLDVLELSEWFDYRSLSSVGDSNPISSWPGTNGIYTLTASGTAQPTYAVDDGDDRPAVQMDGVDDQMAIGINNGTLFGDTGDYEFWLVARLAPTQAVGGGYFCCTGATNQNGFFAITSASADMSMAHGTAQVHPAVSLWDNAWHVIRCAKLGARRILQVDGATIYDETASVGPYGTGPDTLLIGNYFGYYMTGAFRHWLAFTATLDDATAASLTSYLATA